MTDLCIIRINLLLLAVLLLVSAATLLLYVDGQAWRRRAEFNQDFLEAYERGSVVGKNIDGTCYRAEMVRSSVECY